MNIRKAISSFGFIGIVAICLLVTRTVTPALGAEFPAQFDLSTLNGENGFTLNGFVENGFAGSRVSGAGDVNGDGIPDLFIGVPGSDPNGNDSGQSYVVFGSNQGYPAVFELSSLDGTNGFILNGIATEDRLGQVSRASGDVNGDGIDDLIVGAPQADPNDNFSGQSYVLFGTDQGFPPVFELSSLDGTNGFTINGIALNDLSGTGVSVAGDVNGDGIDDIVVGAPNADVIGSFQGQAYVIYGSNQGFPAVIELSALDGSNGFTLNGSSISGLAGSSVSSAGDVNKDGLDDMIIGASSAFSSGESYVVFGTIQGFPSVFELSSLNGTNGFAIRGLALGDAFGQRVSSAGDVNGDGIDDVIIGAPFADPNGKETGQSYVVFGSDQGFPAVIEASSLDGSNGFALNGITQNDRLGTSVSGAGDVDGDGIDDMIIGAPAADSQRTDPGQAYVVYGSDQGFPAVIEASTLDGSNGFTFNGIVEDDFLGVSVSGVKDINGDGFDDFVVAAQSADPNGPASGQIYVVFGGPPLDQTPIANGGGPYTINEGGSLALDASGRTDPNGDETIVRFQWDLDYHGQFDDATGVNPTVSPAQLTALGLPTNGPASFPIALRVTDDGGLSAVDTTTVNVLIVPPVATDDLVSLPKGKSTTIDVLANDIDAIGVGLSVLSTDPASNGTVTLNPDDTVTYSRNGNFKNGCDEFTYTIQDGRGLTDQGLVQVAVGSGTCGPGPGNSPPVADEQAVSTPEDTPVAITLTASDAKGDALTFAIVSNPTDGALSGTAPNVTYTPNVGFTGTDSFTFKANDGIVDSNIATLTIEVAAAPGPTGTVKGTVKKDGKRISGAIVRLDPGTASERQVTTNKAGKFGFDSVPAGIHTFTATDGVCGVGPFPILVTAGQTLTYDPSLVCP